MLANHIWSVAGASSRDDVSTTFLQPFVTYTTKRFTTFGFNTETTYDWEHPQVRRAPPPLALFLGYGNSGINFELRAWIAYLPHWAQVRSDLAVAVYDAVYAAGMTFPFPQREVRVLRDAAGESTTAPVTAARTTETTDTGVETEAYQRRKEVM